MVSEPMAYNIRNASTALGVSRSFIYKLIENGDLKPVIVAGRKLIPRTQLARLLEEAGGDE